MLEQRGLRLLCVAMDAALVVAAPAAAGERLEPDATIQLGDLFEGAISNPAGDARLVKSLGGFTGMQGPNVALISTGVAASSEGSIVQVVCVPDDAQRLELWWNMLSEEFLEYCGSGFQDTFEVTAEVIAPARGDGAITLFTTVIDDHCGSCVEVSSSGGCPTGPCNAPVDAIAGLHFDQAFVSDCGNVYATGWRKQVVDLPEGIAGAVVLLRFRCFDVGDGAFDTVVLLDGIRFL